MAVVLTQEEGGEGGEREFCNYCPPCFCSVWEGKESGIRYPECGILNPFPFVICGKSFRIYNIFLYLSFFLIIEY